MNRHDQDIANSANSAHADASSTLATHTLHTLPVQLPSHTIAPHLFLASTFLLVVPLFKQFMPDYAGKTVAFIATASYVESYGILSRLGFVRMRLMGMHPHFVDLEHDSRDHVREQIENADIIYVCGGNTFYLLEHLQRSGAADVIREQVAYGKAYVAESAGVVAAYDNISYIEPMDNKMRAPELTDYTGLQLFDRPIVPHSGVSPAGGVSAEVMRRMLKHHDRQPLALHENQAVVVEGKRATLLTRRLW